MAQQMRQVQQIRQGQKPGEKNHGAAKVDLSVVIVAWNGAAVIRDCLRSIFSREYRFLYEVIVVDNASTDGTAELIRDEFPQVSLRVQVRNLGYARGNNIGIAMAQGALILLLNQDVELLDNALAELYRCLSERESEGVAAVAPRLEYPDGTVQHTLRRFPTPMNVLRDVISLGAWHARQYDQAISQEVDQPMASCLLLRADVLKRIGGFDDHPNLFLYFNDVDLSMRIHLLGFKHFYLADARAVHHHGQASRQWMEARRLKAWTDGLYYFLAKHYSKKQMWRKALLRLFVFIIYCGRFLGETMLAPLYGKRSAFFAKDSKR